MNMSSLHLTGHPLALFDQLVGAGEHARSNIEAERLGCLEIDHPFILGGRLHRLLALEDAIDIAGCSAKLFAEIHPLRDQSLLVLQGRDHSFCC